MTTHDTTSAQGACCDAGTRIMIGIAIVSFAIAGWTLSLLIAHTLNMEEIEARKSPPCNEWNRFDLTKPIDEKAWMFERVIGVGFNQDGTVKDLTITKCFP